MVGTSPLTCMCIAVERTEVTLPLQVLQERRLELLHLTAVSVYELNAGFIGQLAPTLTSLTCAFERGEVDRDFIGQMLPAPSPLRTFHLEGSIDLEAAQGIITLLADNAPQLCNLALVTLEQELEPEPQAIPLSLLTNLQTLRLSGRPLEKSLAYLLASSPSAPPALPALTELHLPDAYLALEPSSLAALTQLTHLELGAHCCCITRAGGTCRESYLPAIRHMRSLAELVLNVSKRPGLTEQELKEMVPPPASLQSVVVKNTTQALESLVMRVLGCYVKDIEFVSIGVMVES